MKRIVLLLFLMAALGGAGCRLDVPVVPLIETAAP